MTEDNTISNILGLYSAKIRTTILLTILREVDREISTIDSKNLACYKCKISNLIKDIGILDDKFAEEIKTNLKKIEVKP